MGLAHPSRNCLLCEGKIMSVSTSPPEVFLTTREAAERCGLRYQTLCAWRSSGRGGPAYLKLGRKVVYRQSDLDAWLASRRRTHTGQEG